MGDTHPAGACGSRRRLLRRLRQITRLMRALQRMLNTTRVLRQTEAHSNIPLPAQTVSGRAQRVAEPCTTVAHTVVAADKATSCTACGFHQTSAGHMSCGVLDDAALLEPQLPFEPAGNLLLKRIPAEVRAAKRRPHRTATAIADAAFMADKLFGYVSYLNRADTVCGIWKEHKSSPRVRIRFDLDLPQWHRQTDRWTT